MNHIGNTNKMVSETPISDSTPHNVADLGMQIRRLERKLNAANVEMDEKRKDIVYLATEKAKLEERIKRMEEENDAMRADLLFDTYPQTIVRELNRMADRIKRLEEAGDYLCAAAAFMGWHDKIETWNKAKEAKP